MESKQEVSYNKGNITKEQLEKLADEFKIGNSYGDYLRRVIKY